MRMERRFPPARVRRAILLALVCALALPIASASGQGTAQGRWIVLYESAVDDVDAETDRQERGRGFRADFRYRSAVRGFAARLAPAQVRDLRADPDVASVTPDRPVRALGAVPLAAGEPLPPPGVRRIQAATTTTARQASDVGVAVIDTGIDLSHPDLDAVSGRNCVTPGTPAQDDQGHGTHVAGTIAARNDGAGVLGVAPGTKLYAVKVLNSDGDGTWSQVICGIDWVTANAAALNIRVANMSLGGPGGNDANCGQTDGDPLHQAICRSTQAGVTNVVAAGNAGWDFGDSPPDAPASYPEVLTVTAMSDSDGTGGGMGAAPSCRTGEADDVFATFSSYASRAADAAHTIAAPGVCVRSTLPGGEYGSMSGTSMASPHVAGAVALCLSEAGASGPCAGRTPAQIVAHMRSSAEAASHADAAHGFAGDPLSPNSSGNYYGYLTRVAPDTTGPETTLTGGPSGTVSATDAEFAFGSVDPGARLECRLDTAAWSPCTSPHTLSDLADGTHTFSVRAYDVAGNVDPLPATRTWTVDRAAPDGPVVASSPAPDPAPAAAAAPPPATATPAPAAAPAPTAFAPAPDRIAPRFTLAVARRTPRSVATRGLRLSVRCTEACALSARVTVSGPLAKRLGLARTARVVVIGRAVAAARSGTTRTVVVRLGAAARRRLARTRSVALTVHVTARDRAGNAVTVRRAISLRR